MKEKEREKREKLLQELDAKQKMLQDYLRARGIIITEEDHSFSRRVVLHPQQKCLPS